jgi:hypothetical protein
MRYLIIMAIVLSLAGCALLDGSGSASARSWGRKTTIYLPDIRALMELGIILPVPVTPLPPMEPAGQPPLLPPLRPDAPIPATVMIDEYERSGEGKTPPRAIEPAEVNLGTDQPSASSGAAQEVDTAGIRRVEILTWSGIALCVIGGACMIARIWFPILPMSASLVAIGLGVTMILLPDIFDQVPYLLWGAIGLLAVLFIWGPFDNWRKLNAPPPGATS